LNPDRWTLNIQGQIERSALLFNKMTYRYILDLIDDGLIRKGKVLDLGCGPGTAATLLSSLGFDVEAVDILDQQIYSANDSGTVSFIKSDIRSFPIKKGSYDFIHARNVLHFLSKDEIRETIRRMYAGLKPKGVLYFNVSGDKDGWKEKSKNVTFLTDEEVALYVENPIKKGNKPVHSKVIRFGFGTTMRGAYKYTHTISYTVVR